MENFPQGEQGKTRDKVAEQVGFGSALKAKKHGSGNLAHWFKILPLRKIFLNGSGARLVTK